MLRRLRQIALLIVVAAAAVVIRLGLFPRTASDDAAKPEAKAATFRVATYNINYGNARLDLVVEAIRESAADVVALQEVTDQSEPYLREQLGAEYPHMAFQGRPGPYAAQGFGLLSKLPIAKADYLPPEHGLFGMQLVEVEFAGRRVRFVNVHLQPVRHSDVTGPISMVKAVKDAETIHAAEIAWIHAACGATRSVADATDGKSGLDPGVPTVILGDFNSMSSFAAPTFLRANGYTDSFAAVTADADDHPSWEWPTRYGRLRARIDYIFHDAAFETRASRIIANESSDHFLVVSELELRANAD